MLALAVTEVLYSLELTSPNELKRRHSMKKTIAIIITIFSLLLILDSFNFGHALMMFYLAGVIPGTNVILDGAQMLELFAIIAGFIVARVVNYIVLSFIPNIVSVSRVQA